MAKICARCAERYSEVLKVGDVIVTRDQCSNCKKMEIDASRGL